MDRLLPIGEFSQRCGLSQKRLRSYGASGLLIPAAIDPDTGYRYYAEEQIADAQAIDALRRAGMPLREITLALRSLNAERLEGWATSIQVEAERKQAALAAAHRLLATGRHPSATPDRARGTNSMKRLQAAGRTEAGPVRENNEDAVSIGDRFVAVADGLGGHPAGEVASALATELVAATFTGRSPDELVAAVRAANWVVWHQGATTSELAGMGTTICAAGLVEDGGLAVASVGDSRAYLVQQGSFRRLTDDHTITAELVRQGKLSEEEAVEHPDRNILTRALGVGPEIEIDVTTVEFGPGDRLLLCSDGLFTEVSDDDIKTVLLSAPTPAAVTATLVERALSNGGHDNVSVAVATLEE